MRNKWMTLVIITSCVLGGIIGCQSKEATKEEIYKKFQEEVSKVRSYTCKTEIEVVGNKSSNNYVMKQSYNKPNNYKLELISPENLNGNTIEYKGEKIILNNKDINDSLELQNTLEECKYFFVGDFINSYIKDNNISLNDSDGYLVLDRNISEENQYFYKQILYVNKENKYPDKMEILDQQGNIRFTIKYKDFQYKK